MSICTCTHAEKKHCEGGVLHSTYKDQARQVPHPKTTKCLSRHCDEPLCDCTDFKRETAEKA